MPLMYSRKSLGPRMDLWGIPPLTGYSYEDFPSRTTWSCLLLRKEEIRLNIWPEIPQGLNLSRRPACQTLSKALGMSRATVWVAPDLLKALVILSDTTVRRSVVDQEDLKPYWKSEKRPHFSRWWSFLLFTSFSKTLLTTERRITVWLFLAVDFSPRLKIQGPLMRPSNNLGNKTPSDTYWGVQLVYRKVQVHISLEPPLEYNQDQMPLMNESSLWLF